MQAGNASRRQLTIIGCWTGSPRVYPKASQTRLPAKTFFFMSIGCCSLKCWSMQEKLQQAMHDILHDRQFFLSVTDDQLLLHDLHQCLIIRKGPLWRVIPHISSTQATSSTRRWPSQTSTSFYIWHCLQPFAFASCHTD